jgi:hypothetical protein
VFIKESHGGTCRCEYPHSVAASYSALFTLPMKAMDRLKSGGIFFSMFIKESYGGVQRCAYPYTVTTLYLIIIMQHVKLYSTK